mgnify:CR=1 FL=1
MCGVATKSSGVVKSEWKDTGSRWGPEMIWGRLGLLEWCVMCCLCVFFFQAEDGIRGLVRSRGLGDVYKRQVYGRLGHVEDEIREYQIALRLNPNDAEVHYNLAITYGQLGQMDKAIPEFQAVVQLAPGFAQGYYWLGIALEREGHVGKALEAAETAFRLGYEEAFQLVHHLRQRYSKKKQ